MMRLALSRLLRLLPLILILYMALGASARAAEGEIVLLTVDGAISPATADYAIRGIRKAAGRGAQLVVIQLDTPGGLDTSMRLLVKEILAAPVPVATFVAPSGARAASAGTFLLYASHIAAMAPATNLGAATPVQIGGGAPQEPSRQPGKSKDGKADPKDERAGKDAMTSKQVEDAAAYIRSLAQLRGRNADWGERAVREAVSLSATDAVKVKAVDLVANDVPDLLKKLDGRTVTVQGVERRLKTAGAATTAIEPDWRTRVLAVIAHPSVALVLMMIGIYGLLFEFSNPGFVLPGIAGAICLLLAFYAFHLLPVDYTGVALILLGIALIVAEAFAPSFGALGIGGVVALVMGLVIFIDPETAGAYAPSPTFIAALAILTTAAVFATVTFALKARRQPVVSGREDMIGAPGEALAAFEREGWVRVRGESWQAVSSAPLAPGQKVRVTGMEGLVLSVEPDTRE
jgi:membrane-bound serine protease (ClpP class)